MERIGRIALLADLRKAAGLTPGRWYDLIRAVGELAVARWRLAHSDTRELIRADEADRDTNDAAAVLSPAALAKAGRVGFAVTRMGPRVPWRADCLVQALAARHWLASAGIASALHIGVRNEGEFAAHAWLTVGGQVVTGETVGEFATLLGPGSGEQAQPRSAAEFSTNQR